MDELNTSTEEQQTEGTSAEGGNTDAGQKPWLAQLKGDLQKNDKLTPFDTISDLGKAYVELSGRADKLIEPVTDDADDETVSNFYAKLGKPDAPESYKLPKVGDADPDADAKIRKMFHDSNLTQKQAEKLYNDLATDFATALAEREQQISAKVEANKATLQAEWGKSFESNLEKVRQTLAALGGGEDFAAALMDASISHGADAMRTLHKIADHVLGDEFFTTQGNPGNANNSDPQNWYPNTKFD